MLQSKILILRSTDELALTHCLSMDFWYQEGLVTGEVLLTSNLEPYIDSPPMPALTIEHDGQELVNVEKSKGFA